MSLAAPEFGPRKLYAILGRAAGQDDDDTFAVIWNPADSSLPVPISTAPKETGDNFRCRPFRDSTRH